MIRRFINRKEELKLLENEWKKENAFVVVYGRRRIGKTRLIEEFIKDKKGVFYTVEDVNRHMQMNEFKNIIANYLNDDFLKEMEIKDWRQLFSYLEKTLNRNKKFYIWIDEFSYILKNSPEITSILQNFIDKFLRKSKIFFIVSGSLFGIMNEKVLSSSSPLYGRRTRDILLLPLDFSASAKFVSYSFEDKLKLYLTIGGIPEYLLIASNYENYKEFIKNEFFRKNGYFYREPYFLLSREFKEIKTYFSILAAISFGNTTPTNLANFVGIKTREIYPYLENLIAYEFVKKIESFSSKKSIYIINDVFFDFWFNFVYKNRNRIEMGNFYAEEEKINKYFGKRFEYFIANIVHKIFPNFSLIKKDWGKIPKAPKGKNQYEIDIVALNEKTKEILFTECKWKDKVNPEKICKELIEKSQCVKWNNENRKESFAIFAKSFSKKIKEYQGRKVYCFDLKDLEKVLKNRKF